MPISTLLNPENILCHVQCQSRKRALQLAAQSIAENDPDRDGLVADEVFAGLVERERLGSTGLGFGVAIPHCRMACQSIHATFMSLEESVDMGTGQRRRGSAVYWWCRKMKPMPDVLADCHGF